MEWKKAVKMILLIFFYFVRSDLKKNSKEVSPLITVENENGNVQYDCVKSGMSHNYDSANEQPNLIIIKEPNVGIMY